MQLALKEIDLSRIHLLKRDGWRGEDMDLHLTGMHLDADTLDLTGKIARIRTLEFNQPDFTISNYKGRRPTPPVDTAAIIDDPAHLRLNPAGWDLTAASLIIRNGSFR